MITMNYQQDRLVCERRLHPFDFYHSFVILE